MQQYCPTNRIKLEDPAPTSNPMMSPRSQSDIEGPRISEISDADDVANSPHDDYGNENEPPAGGSPLLSPVNTCNVRAQMVGCEILMYFIGDTSQHYRLESLLTHYTSSPAETKQFMCLLSVIKESVLGRHEHKRARCLNQAVRRRSY